jgi:hypothetical protein
MFRVQSSTQKASAKDGRAECRVSLDRHCPIPTPSLVECLTPTGGVASDFARPVASMLRPAFVSSSGYWMVEATTSRSTILNPIVVPSGRPFAERPGGVFAQLCFVVRAARPGVSRPRLPSPLVPLAARERRRVVSVAYARRRPTDQSDQRPASRANTARAPLGCRGPAQTHFGRSSSAPRSGR